jgi:hypothetical protein
MKWSFGKDGIRSMGQSTMSMKISKRKQKIKEQPRSVSMNPEEEVPFGPPPEEYNYRCSRCGCEVWVNEAIIDFELGFAEFEGRYVEGWMPLIGCPGCNQETMEYTGIKKSSPEGR